MSKEEFLKALEFAVERAGSDLYDIFEFKESESGEYYRVSEEECENRRKCFYEMCEDLFSSFK